MKKLCTTAEVGPGTARAVETEAGPVALYNVEGTIYATSGTCLHAGGPLGEGRLAGRDITCPWHGWTFDVTTGGCRTNPESRVKCFKVEVRDGDVYVQL